MTEKQGKPGFASEQWRHRILRELSRLENLNRPGCMGGFSTGQPGHSLHGQLDRAQIGVLLAEGPETVSRIYDHLHPSLHLLLLGPRPRSLEEAVRLVAMNLDWYLGPPRPVFRMDWVWQVVLTAALLWATVSWLQVMFDPSAFNRAPLLLSPLVAGVCWFLAHGQPKRAYWIRQLRRYFEVTGSDRHSPEHAV